MNLREVGIQEHEEDKKKEEEEDKEQILQRRKETIIFAIDISCKNHPHCHLYQITGVCFGE